MKLTKLLRTSTFQLALVYMTLFATSVFILLGFIYWATAGYMARQTDETIEAEIQGLAEQYQRQGLEGLISVIHERTAKNIDGSSVYLFTSQDGQYLAGNLLAWPDAEIKEGWISFYLDERVAKPRGGDSHLVRGRVFRTEGGMRLLVGRDVHNLMEVQELVSRALTWGMGVTVALAFAGGLFMSRSTLKRIESINQTSREIMKGDLSRRIPTRGSGDDFDQLAENLNAMLEQIEVLMEGVRHVSNNIAHDLRTPLTRLRNRLENMQSHTHDPLQAQESITQALLEADRILQTFNALLRISRIESGGFQRPNQKVSLKELVADAADLYEALALDKEQTFDVDLHSDVEILGDRDLLFQALANLLDNAIKYTPERGHIKVWLERGAKARLVVSDSGVGVPSAERDKVFERFYRVDKDRSTLGNGLGLSLVKAVVELHRGRIWLEDNDPGLRVVLELPYA